MAAHGIAETDSWLGVHRPATEGTVPRPGEGGGVPGRGLWGFRFGVPCNGLMNFYLLGVGCDSSAPFLDRNRSTTGIPKIAPPRWIDSFFIDSNSSFQKNLVHCNKGKRGAAPL